MVPFKTVDKHNTVALTASIHSPFWTQWRDDQGKAVTVVFQVFKSKIKTKLILGMEYPTGKAGVIAKFEYSSGISMTSVVSYCRRKLIFGHQLLLYDLCFEAHDPCWDTI